MSTSIHNIASGLTGPVNLLLYSRWFGWSAIEWDQALTDAGVEYHINVWNNCAGWPGTPEGALAEYGYSQDVRDKDLSFVCTAEEQLAEVQNNLSGLSNVTFTNKSWNNSLPDTLPNVVYFQMGEGTAQLRTFLECCLSNLSSGTKIIIAGYTDAAWMFPHVFIVDQWCLANDIILQEDTDSGYAIFNLP
jgi:hypothetical protein